MYNILFLKENRALYFIQTISFGNNMNETIIPVVNNSSKIIRIGSKMLSTDI